MGRAYSIGAVVHYLMIIMHHYIAKEGCSTMVYILLLFNSVCTGGALDGGS